MSEKKKYKAILFDMDGTLVPLDTYEFSIGYFKGLCKKLKHHNMNDEEVVKSIWAGTKAMVMNDGSKPNEEVFWEVFEKLMGKGKGEIDADCLDFYKNEFHEAISYTGPNPYAVEAVKLARSKADLVILATNPLFPMVGQITRMGYVGLTPDMFDHVSCYENDRFCKPNPKYYIETLKKFNLDPKDCLMIGNDEFEDAWSVNSLGMDCYLVTDRLIPSDKYHHNGPRGTFINLLEFLKNL